MRQFFPKFFSISVAVFLLFIAITHVVLADASPAGGETAAQGQPIPPKSPATNPVCWTKQLCEDAKGDFCESGSTQCPAATLRCGGSWGFCYDKPANNPAKLQIHIGGAAQVTDISAYVRLLYQVGLGLAVLAAIVLIMVAGFRWMTSAGNTNTIGQAKTMIGNSVIGLALLFGAFVIFQTINPDIVSLSLPRVAKLRGQILNSSNWCLDLYSPSAASAESLQFAYAGIAPHIDPANKFGAKDYQKTTKGEMTSRDCGNAYYNLSDPSTECYSRHCSENNQVCLGNQPDGSFKCTAGVLGGTLRFDTAHAPISVQFFTVCNQSTRIEGGYGADPDLSGNRYIFSKPDIEFGVGCKDEGGLKGLLLGVWADNINTGVIDTNDAVAIDKRTCQRLTEVSANDLAAKDIPVEALYQPQDLDRGGLECNINIMGVTTHGK